MLRILGIVILGMALIIAIIPQFTTCESQGRAITLANGTTVPMKCKWTAQAELGIAIPLLAVGALMTTHRRQENRLGFPILGIILGIVVLLIPTYLIGVCQTLMVCHTIMQPVLLSAGSVVIVASLFQLFALRKADKS